MDKLSNINFNFMPKIKTVISLILLITIFGKIYINGINSEKEDSGKVKFEKEKNVGKLDFSLFFENIIEEDDTEDENQDYFHLNAPKISFSFKKLFPLKVNFQNEYLKVLFTNKVKSFILYHSLKLHC